MGSNMRRRSLCLTATIALAAFGQSSQSPATTNELQYFRFMLMNLASIDHGVDAIALYERALIRQFGFNQQESALVHAAAMRLNALQRQLRSSSQAIRNGKNKLSGGDVGALERLDAQREQLIITLSNEILNSVRPETADRLRGPGRVLGSRAKN